ncbi:hypothetical protein MP478_04285 [Chryseobacterium sp. WG14]|uniref:hypothetical protein n=1 Tax=Chryseobacterium sp. WG14 TaxID=2926909 RepID=UPI00211EABE0|nr:hypothetical protein [Chryseobacterium sp. WG14]MCQ9638598.1 hypothetical protein [Chryseobacterium sp. WG14]
MDRIELINKGADAVRNTPHLFSAYKQYLLEDWGELPQGCFGCQFNNHFNQWKNQVLNKNIIPMENKIVNNNKTYVLKDRGTLKYLNGDVWSNNSSDEDWIKYINLKPQAKDLFYVLPVSIEKTRLDLDNEEDFKKKESNESLMTEDVVGDLNIVDQKPKRGRKKQD